MCAIYIGRSIGRSGVDVVVSWESRNGVDCMARLVGGVWLALCGSAAVSVRAG
jgi:hypothetical protein